MKNKLKLALAAVLLHMIFWVVDVISPLLFLTSGFGVQTVYKILYTFAVFAPLPFFIALYKDKSALAIGENGKTEAHHSNSPKKILGHIVSRLLIIIGIFVLSYVVITAGKSDPMGYGIAYAGIACVILTFLVLIVDAVRIHRAEKDSSRFYANIFILAILAVGLLSFLNMS